MPGRPRTVSDEQVFAAVTRIIGRVGPAGLTFAAVAQEAGLSAPALSQRYGSKKGLLVAYAGAGQAVPSSFDRAEQRARSSLGALLLAIETLVTPVSSPEEMAHSIAFLHLDLTDEDLKVHAVAQSRDMRRRIEGLLERAVEAGELVATDTTRLATAVYTTYNGALITWAIDGTGSLARWARQRVEAVLAPYRP